MNNAWCLRAFGRTPPLGLIAPTIACLARATWGDGYE